MKKPLRKEKLIIVRHNIPKPEPIETSILVNGHILKIDKKTPQA